LTPTFECAAGVKVKERSRSAADSSPALCGDEARNSGKAFDQRKAQAKKGVGTTDPGMIGYTLPEIRRLLNSLVTSSGDSDRPVRQSVLRQVVVI
jgi:hypothetical protein